MNFKNTLSNYVPTSEELYIQDYLDKIGFKYVCQYKIDDLKEDSKSYRIVDFYLPRLNIYVEYFGMYNSNKVIRENYDRKASVYIKNNKPTVFLYPHELGFLDYAFHSKILKVLRVPKFKNNFTIFKYKLTRYWALGKGYLFFSSIFWLYMTFVFLFEETGLNRGMNSLFSLTCIVVFSFFVLRFGRNIINYFYYDN